MRLMLLLLLLEQHLPLRSLFRRRCRRCRCRRCLRRLRLGSRRSDPCFLLLLLLLLQLLPLLLGLAGGGLGPGVLLRPHSNVRLQGLLHLLLLKGFRPRVHDLSGRR